MKAFHYRLQTKLDICCRQEQIAREELQRCINECERLMEELQRIINRLLDMEEGIRGGLSQISFQELLLKKEYIPVLKIQINKIEILYLQAENKAEQARILLLERAKETQTLEKLKERAWTGYLYELQREEQKIIDEIANNNHYRKNMA